MNLEETEVIPFSFKLSLAKVIYQSLLQVLVEVDEFKDSLILLEKLVEEDETNLDVVYMMAFVNFKLQNYNITQEILNDIRNDEKVIANLKDD